MNLKGGRSDCRLTSLSAKGFFSGGVAILTVIMNFFGFEGLSGFWLKSLTAQHASSRVKNVMVARPVPRLVIRSRNRKIRWVPE